jgi:hypothetical protein
METLKIYSKSKSNARLLIEKKKKMGDIIVENSSIPDVPQTHIASENALSKEWLTTEEDTAWKDL